MKELTKELRAYYSDLASKKIQEDRYKVRKFCEKNNLSPGLEEESSENEAYHHYDVAKKLWEADGYTEVPGSYVKTSEREKNLVDVLMNHIIKDCEEETDKLFFECVDRIVEKEK